MTKQRWKTKTGNAADAKTHETRRPVKSNRLISPDGTHRLEGRRDEIKAIDGQPGGEERIVWSVFRMQSPGNYYIERE